MICFADPKYKLAMDKDGPNGPHDPTSTVTVILDWMITGDNYSGFTGDRVIAATKLQIAKEIIKIYKHKNIKVVRNPADIVQKMCNLCLLYKKADKWKNNTGQGLLDKREFKRFNDVLRKICPYWDVLKPVLGTCDGVVGLWDGDCDDVALIKTVEANDKTEEEQAKEEIEYSQNKMDYLVGLQEEQPTNPTVVDISTNNNKVGAELDVTSSTDDTASCNYHYKHARYGKAYADMNTPHTQNKLAKLALLNKRNGSITVDNKRSILKAVNLIQETLKRSVASKEADIEMKREKNDLLKQKLELQQEVKNCKKENKNFDAESKWLGTFHKLKNKYGYSYNRIKTMRPQLSCLCNADKKANKDNNAN